MKKTPEVLTKAVRRIIENHVYWYNNEQNRFYLWDKEKGELQVYDMYGYHLGTLNSEMNKIGKADKRRNINVE